MKLNGVVVGRTPDIFLKLGWGRMYIVLTDKNHGREVSIEGPRELISAFKKGDKITLSVEKNDE